MKLFKKWVMAFLVINVVLLAAIAILVYVMDPLQYFRPISFYKPVYSYDKRLAIPGIIRNFDYGSLIMGSSTAQNFKPSQVERLFGESCVKLTVPGASARELSLMFEEAAKHRDIKIVILGVDSFAFAGDPLRLRAQRPDYLYKLNVRNAYRYFYDGYVLKKILTKTDWTTVFDSKTYAFDHDLFAYNGDKKRPSRARTIRTFFDPHYAVPWCGDLFSHESRKSFRANVIDVVRKYPETVFYLYFSPSSILDWLIRDRNGDIDKLMEFRSYVTEQCQQLENVRLFDFQPETSITHNLDLYYDITHYDETVNERIVHDLHSGRHRTDPQKCQRANHDIVEQIERFKRNVLPAINNPES